MEFVSAVPIGNTLAFYRICKIYTNAFIATLEKCTDTIGQEQPPKSVFFIKGESGCLGDAVHRELIRHLSASVDVQQVHAAVLGQDDL